jgi:polysaccharide pyruvyl transferase CsaB
MSGPSKGGVLFSGYYGLGNAGDEAVLEASVAMFRERRPELPITVLTADPEGTAKALNVQVARRMRAGALRAIRKCGVFLSGGGSLLQDRTSLKSLLYYLLLLDLARRSGAKTMVFAQGIGPLVRPSARTATAKVLSRVHAITVRDADSADLIRSLGVKGPAIEQMEVTADPVFALPPQVTERVNKAASQRPLVGVSLRPWPGSEHILPPLAEALARVPAGVRVQAWPLFRDEDLPQCEELARLLPDADVIREPLQPREWMALAGWSNVVIGMRLHSLIFAAARAVPVLGISYDPKVDALLGRLRSSPIARADQLDTEKVRQSLLQALEDTEERRRDREARAEHLRAAAYRNVDRALALLD